MLTFILWLLYLGVSFAMVDAGKGFLQYTFWPYYAGRLLFQVMRKFENELKEGS